MQLINDCLISRFSSVISPPNSKLLSVCWNLKPCLGPASSSSSSSWLNPRGSSSNWFLCLPTQFVDRQSSCSLRNICPFIYSEFSVWPDSLLVSRLALVEPVSMESYVLKINFKDCFREVLKLTIRKSICTCRLCFSFNWTMSACTLPL